MTWKDWLKMPTMNDAPPSRCERCGVFPQLGQPSCVGCGRVRPPCGCTRGWSQSANMARLGEVEHRCPHCTLVYP